jgi:hypothetical protein
MRIRRLHHLGDRGVADPKQLVNNLWREHLNNLRNGC